MTSCDRKLVRKGPAGVKENLFSNYGNTRVKDGVSYFYCVA